MLYVKNNVTQRTSPTLNFKVAAAPTPLTGIPTAVAPVPNLDQLVSQEQSHQSLRKYSRRPHPNLEAFIMAHHGLSLQLRKPSP